MKIKYDILVVGAGGTGTYFLKEFSRYISGNPAAKKFVRELMVMDGDVVEKKNLARQCFLPEDIGREKAVVMAEALNDAFDLQWSAYPQYLTTMEQLEARIPLALKEQGADAVIPLVISCVDNHAARLLLEAYFDKAQNLIIFDSANEFENGEAVFAYKMKGKVLAPCRSTYFPDIREGDLRDRTEVSCEELNNVAPQHIFTNMYAGLVLCSAVADLFNGNARTGWVSFNPFQFSSELFPSFEVK